jgi:hypothetical protein
MVFSAFCITCAYKQCEKVFVYADSTAHRELIHNILDPWNISYADVDSIVDENNEGIYIIVGDVNSMQVHIPAYYFVYQTKSLNKSLSESFKTLASHAVALWDFSNENINTYKGLFKHYNYLPNEKYEFLDPVILPLFLQKSALNAYKKLLEYSNEKSSDISSHVSSLFCHCMFQKPSLVVEAGVRWGDGSTIPLYEAASLSNARMMGIDIVDCSHIYKSLLHTTFLKMSDLDFPNYLTHMNNDHSFVDFVFIDTSHQLEHSLKEIAGFVSILSENGTLGFHDSNPLPADPRGVVDALKQYFGLPFDESKYFNTVIHKNGCSWNIIHYPFNNGMTIVKRLSVVKKFDL